MDKQEFLEKMGCFIEGPEHNAYYDVLEILEACLTFMTPNQREAMFTFMKEKKMVEVPEPKRKKQPENVKPVFSVKEAEVIISLLDQEAKRIKSPKTQDLLRSIIAKIQNTDGYQQHTWGRGRGAIIMKYIILQMTIVPAEGVDVEKLKEMLLKGETTMDSLPGVVYEKGGWFDPDHIGKLVGTVEKTKASVWPQDLGN